ncbi:MAG: PorT family protein [Bacteroidia bacterium]|nr:PorT family protein [Bacteroidia bacterium]MBT8288400.1 PorT family protein [Bacteroidia bacterium]NNK71972.1 PorT family protein [Flavobacteriaceae bacterium]
MNLITYPPGKSVFISFLLCLLPIIIFSQSQGETTDDQIDTKYREDQFYVGITYNLLNNIADEIAQTGFSSGFHFGFIRDFPLNESRNFGVGIGIGYSANSVNHNLLIQDTGQNDYSYTIAEDGTFSKNKFSLHLVELPFEFRWRSSTATNYKFWRVYAGFKFGYVLSSSIKYRGEPKDFKLKNIDDFNKVAYGLTLTAGYDKFNVHLYYMLNHIFKDESRLNNQVIDMSFIKLGLMLYIL